MKSIRVINSNGIELNDLLLISPKIFPDARGFFFESWNQRDFDNLIGDKIIFKQDNHSMSKKGVLRGIHYQLPPFDQGKLVRCSRGRIYDFVIDLRKYSSSFAQWFWIELSAQNQKQFWIPAGFGHGFLTLSEEAEVQYKTTNYWNKEAEITLNFYDQDLKIELPLENLSSDKIQLSLKDKNSSNLKELIKNNKIFL